MEQKAEKERMQIFLHGKTDAFILLRTLLFSAVLIILLSAALSITIALFRQSSEINLRSNKLIQERNTAALQDLDERP